MIGLFTSMIVAGQETAGQRSNRVLAPFRLLQDRLGDLGLDVEAATACLYQSLVTKAEMPDGPAQIVVRLHDDAMSD